MIFRDLAQAAFNSRWFLLLLWILAGLAAASHYLRSATVAKRAPKKKAPAKLPPRAPTEPPKRARWQATPRLSVISTHLFGPVIATIGFGMFLVILQQYAFIQTQRADLVLKMGSDQHWIAVGAVRQLRSFGWLENGSLRGIDLRGANLSGADLEQADLSGAGLQSANLSGAWLWQANLSGADLTGADLSGAGLWQANLSGADLTGANLSGVLLWQANLSGANLLSTFDETSLLPDAPRQGWDKNGKPLFDKSGYWTPDTDMSRYTDPHHPDFWQSDNPYSPAYRGEGGSAER